jgi:hypothetical protein
MKILERQIQKVDRTSWAKKAALEKRFDVVEARLGYPPTRRYRAMCSASDFDTRVNEREWSSLAVFEATLEKALADPEHQALAREGAAFVLSNHFELYLVEG